MKALVVDDDTNIRLIMDKMLKMINFDVDFAENGQECVLKLKRKTYDIIFLDIRMPGISGEQVLNIIEKLNRSLPIVITSGNLTKDTLDKLSNRDIKGVLAKPFGAKTFFNTINQVCNTQIRIQH